MARATPPQKEQQRKPSKRLRREADLDLAAPQHKRDIRHKRRHDRLKTGTGLGRKRARRRRAIAVYVLSPVILSLSAIRANSAREDACILRMT